MSPSFQKRFRPARLRGRRCVRCGKKLEGYRRIFCGADCRKEDRREKMQLKREKGRQTGKCPTCGRRAPSGETGVTVHTGAGSRDRGGGGVKVRGGEEKGTERPACAEAAAG